MDLHRHLRSLALLIFVLSANFSEAEASQGCKTVSHNTSFGCCPDGHTPAHGHNEEGCCITTQHGCCPDNILAAGGPALQGCECANSKYGCCPNGVDYAKGPRKEGCGCKYTEFGCCQDGFTEATGPDYAGCSCETFQFGCCPDGETTAKGAANLGCGCKESEFGCCPDKATPAKGPDFEGCGCDASEFGCCPDGVEAAQGEKFEECADAPKFSGEACALPRDRGTCNNLTNDQWFFDTEYAGCLQFWYGGCEGNNNRFNSEDDCKNSCEAPPGRDACFLPKISGPCVNYKTLWHYDTEKKACTQFVYGGCRGNNNKFETLEECKLLCAPQELRDKCAQPKLEGPCNGEFERWFFSSEESVCKRFIFGGCKGNQNNFLSENACKQQCQSAETNKDVCSGAAPSNETCGSDQKLARWRFESESNRCLPFYTKGCDPNNRNSFIAEEHCLRRCPPKQEENICRLAPAVGECRNYVSRWFYNVERQQCMQFYYGGCGGNSNNFEREEDCSRQCKQQAEPEESDRAAEPKPVDLCGNARRGCEYHHNICYYGVEQFMDNNKCERCMCNEPCKNTICPEYTTCVIEQIQTCDQEARQFRALCRRQHEAPQIQLPEPVVRVFEGSECTLKCHTQGNPQPTITWFKNQVIDGSRGRHRLLPEGSLQIIGVMKEDAGNYNCTAHNGVGSPAVRTIRVDVLDTPGRSDVEVVEVDPYVRVHLLTPAVLHCYAMGWPRPSVTWFRGDQFLPLSGKHFEQRRDFTLLLKAVSVDDLGRYTCQAHNGVGKARSWTVTVQAYRSPGGHYSQSESYYQYLIEPPTPSVGARHPYTQQLVKPVTAEPEPVDHCANARRECEYNQTNCHYGIEQFMDENQCARCRCNEPCKSTICPEYTRCVVELVQIYDQEARLFQAVCRQTEKQGVCPPAKEGAECEHTCQEDSNCPGSNKCCFNGCANRCHDPNTVVTKQEEPAITPLNPELSPTLGQQIHPKCTDSRIFQNCKLIVLGKYCNHKYYSRFCCRSCTEDGQLPLNGPHLPGFVPASSANN